jgi:multimeric flavodoxin WrbA
MGGFVMKVVAVIGSPRMNGNTYKTVKMVEARMKVLDPDIEFEIIQLAKIDLKTCKGCYLCLSKGESYCPLKDDRELLECKLKSADAIIFGSPVYTYNVSWIMKNFLDRFAYRCHRPDFHGKKSMIIITTGAVGLGFVGWIMGLMIGAMGFIASAKLGITYAPQYELSQQKVTKEKAKLQKKTDRFYNTIIDNNPIKPTMIKLITFKLQQKGFGNAPKELADYQYWKQKGWLEKDCDYFYNVKISSVKKRLASMIAKLVQ